jgi:hypothetical protein
MRFTLKCQLYCLFTIPNQQIVVFDARADHLEVVNHAAHSKTMLMGYFEANKNYEFEINSLYVDFPKSFTWQAKSKKWAPHHGGKNIGHMHFASPATGEHFYLWALLCVVKGATSFEDLRTFEGSQYESFKAACLA